jgi:hypothetical protein
MPFIALTDKGGRSVFVNAARVTVIRSGRNGETVLEFDSPEHSIGVRGDADKIAAMLSGASVSGAADAGIAELARRISLILASEVK